MSTPSHRHAGTTAAIRRRTLLAATALLAPGLAAAQASNFPNHPIRLVVPFPAGGSVDPLARTIAEKMSQSLGQNVIVDNRPGGNTVIGTDHVAKAAPDGYTILLTASSHVTQPQLLQAPYDPIKDFTPIAMVSKSNMILAVNPSVPANSVQELIALAKQKPGALNYSSAGNGNPNHLAGELLSMMTGAKFTHVPYKGGGPAVTDLVGGQVQFSFTSPIVTLPHIRAGRLRAIGITGKEPAAVLPQVPPIAQAVPGYEVTIWYGMVGPANMPKDIVAKLAAEINRITALPETKERLDAAGMERFSVPTEQFEAAMKSDMEKFGRIIKTANVKLD